MENPIQVDINQNYQQVLERIAQAARSVGRDPQEVSLVVVTKGHSADAIRQAIAAGAQRLGENYPEEAVDKIAALSGEAAFAGAETRVQWHMIGHIQSRKAKIVCEHFDWVHSLDSLKLARRLDRFASEAGRQLPVLLECNVSGEETKYGWAAWQEDAWPGLLADFAALGELPGLQVRGLMTMAPFFDDPEEARPYFQRLRRLQRFLMERLPELDWGELSMGMSGDYEVAVQEGATLVRVGTAIMGRRLYAES